MSLFDKLFAPDPYAPKQQPAPSVPTVPREDFAAVRAATSVPVPKQVNPSVAELVRSHMATLPNMVTQEPLITSPEQLLETPKFQAPAINFEEAVNVAEEKKKFAEALTSEDVAEARKTVEVRNAWTDRDDDPEKQAETWIAETDADAMKKEGEKKSYNPDQIYGGRQLVAGILTEFNDLIVAGNELEGLNIKKEKLGKQGESLESIAKQEKEGRDKIAQAMTNLFSGNLGGDGVTMEKLTEAQKAFDVYAETAKVKAEALIGTESMAYKAILMKINQKKAEIDKLFKLIGGTEVMESVKRAIQVAERIAKRQMEVHIGAKIAPAILDKMHKIVLEKYLFDPHGMRMLAEGGSILDVMIYLFDEKRTVEAMQKLPKIAN